VAVEDLAVRLAGGLRFGTRRCAASRSPRRRRSASCAASGPPVSAAV